MCEGSRGASVRRGHLGMCLCRKAASGEAAGEGGATGEAGGGRGGARRGGYRDQRGQLREEGERSGDRAERLLNMAMRRREGGRMEMGEEGEIGSEL